MSRLFVTRGNFWLLVLSGYLLLGGNSKASANSFPIDFSRGCRELVTADLSPHSRMVEGLFERVETKLHAWGPDVKSAKISSDAKYAVVELKGSGKLPLLFLIDTPFKAPAAVIGEVRKVNQNRSAALVFSGTGEVQIWNLTTFAPPASISLPKLAGGVANRSELLRARSDFSQFAIQTRDGLTYVWNPRAEGISLAVMGPGSSVLLVREKFIRLLDFETGKPIRDLVGHRGPVRFLKVNQDFTRALSASDDGTARVWDLVTGQQVSEYPIGDYTNVKAIRASRDMKSVRISIAEKDPVIWAIP